MKYGTKSSYGQGLMAKFFFLIGAGKLNFYLLEKKIKIPTL
jgi:hypothetical protein